MPTTVRSLPDGIRKARSVRHFEPVLQALAASLAAVPELH